MTLNDTINALEKELCNPKTDLLRCEWIEFQLANLYHRRRITCPHCGGDTRRGSHGVVYPANHNEPGSIECFPDTEVPF